MPYTRRSSKRRIEKLEKCIVRQTADITKNANTTLADLTGLIHDIVPGTYKYRVHLQMSAGASGGVKAAFKYTGVTLTSIQNMAQTTTASATTAARTTTATDEASLVASTSAVVEVTLEGTFVASVGGSIQVRGAQNASNGTDTIFYTGSTFELQRVA